MHMDVPSKLIFTWHIYNINVADVSTNTKN